MKRLLLHSLALICVGLGIAGAFLPLLPTTPFILAAAGLSAKASPRLHQWLLHHPLFGESLRRYQRHKAISPTAFRNAMLMLWPTIGLSCYWAERLWLTALLLVIASCVSLFLWQARSRGKALLNHNLKQE